jgi:hypothetical protein
MGTPALSIRDEFVAGISRGLNEAGYAVIERLPANGDCADLYIDCQVAHERFTICLQPNPSALGYHVLTVIGRIRGPLFDVRQQLFALGATERWPDAT